MNNYPVYSLYVLVGYLFFFLSLTKLPNLSHLLNVEVTMVGIVICYVKGIFCISSFVY
jgi:hypothetical protein